VTVVPLCPSLSPHQPRFAGIEDCDLGFFPHLDGAVACDTSNGLLLFRFTGGKARFYVVNPVACRWITVPRSLSDPTLSMLAFDPSASAPCYHVVSFTGPWRAGCTPERVVRERRRVSCRGTPGWGRTGGSS
jgi:hypothetical protein